MDPTPNVDAPVDPEQLRIAQESYSRCCAIPGFFQRLYDHLLNSAPEVKPYFAHTEFDRQTKVVEHGVGLLLIYAKRRNPALLERIAQRHARGDVGVKPAMYELFVNALVAALQELDPEFDAAVEAAWRAAVVPGIEFMAARY